MPRRLRQGTSGSLKYKNFGKLSIADNKIFSERQNESLHLITSGTGTVTTNDIVEINGNVSLPTSGSGVGVGGNVNFGAINLSGLDGIDNHAFGTTTPSDATFTDFESSGIFTAGALTDVVVELTNSTGTVFHDFSAGTTFRHTTPQGDFTVALNSFPTNLAGKSFEVTVIVDQGAIAYIPTAVTLNGGGNIQLYWNGGFTPSNTVLGIPNRLQIFKFDINNATGGQPNANVSIATFGQTLDGSIQALAAPSAKFIKTINPSATSGVYWIDHGNGPYEVYCDMDYGGHVLIAKIANTTSSSSPWLYNGSYWSATTAQDETTCQNLNDGNALARGYYGYSIQNNLRLCLGNKDNAIIYATSSTTPRNLFTGSAINLNALYTRQDFLNWFVAGTGQSAAVFNNQPFCNRIGFNRSDSASQAMRFGITMNNENDCNSNDSSIGFGTYTNGNTTGPRAIPAGGHRWNPDAQYPATGFIFAQ